MQTSTSHKLTSGFTLIEAVTVIGLVALFLLFSSHFSSSIFSTYQARNEVHATTLALMLDAQRIRTLARTHKTTMSIMPICNNSWESGWIAFHNPELKFNKEAITNTLWKKEISPQVTTIRPKGSAPVSGTQFADISIKSFSHPKCQNSSIALESGEKLRHLSFNALGAAQTKNGGFVANRVVFWSKIYPNIEYHLVLGDSGRLRLCKPEAVNPKCTLSL
jgi:type IV fimbrial biogenesis protein FimT